MVKLVKGGGKIIDIVLTRHNEREERRAIRREELRQSELSHQRSLFVERINNLRDSLKSKRSIDAIMMDITNNGLSPELADEFSFVYGIECELLRFDISLANPDKIKVLKERLKKLGEFNDKLKTTTVDVELDTEFIKSTIELANSVANKTLRELLEIIWSKYGKYVDDNTKYSQRRSKLLLVHLSQTNVNLPTLVDLIFRLNRTSDGETIIVPKTSKDTRLLLALRGPEQIIKEKDSERVIHTLSPIDISDKDNELHIKMRLGGKVVLNKLLTEIRDVINNAKD